MKNRQNSNTIQPSIINIIPVIIALAIVPLIVRLKVLEAPKENLVWATKNPVMLVDIFNYYKGTWLIIAAVIAIGIVLYNIYFKKITLPKYKSYLLLFTYMVFAILAFMFSINKDVSLIGYNEHFENIFILITYILLFMYTSIFITTERQIKIVLFAWIGAILIMFIVGLTQFVNNDIFFTSVGRSLIIPTQYANANMKADAETIRNVYQTLYHYNYVSFYVAIALPFFLVLSILEKNMKFKLLYIGITCMMIFNQFASLSRNGFVGILVALIFVAILLRKIIFKHWKIITPVFGIVFIGVAIFFTTSESLTVRRIKDAVSELTTKQNYPLNTIETREDEVIIDHDDYYVKIKYEPENTSNLTTFSFYDRNDQPIEYVFSPEHEKYTFNSINPNKLLYQYAEINKWPSPFITIGKTTWYFTYTEQGFAYLNPSKVLDTIPNVESIGFEGRERFGSERGYIWSRTLPVIKDNPLFGTGPDTFALAFPQNDYVGKLSAYGIQNIVVDKAHNIYLGYAMSTGLPSLIALLLFWGMYIAWSFKLYFKSSFDTFSAKIGVASLTAVIGYLASGIFNDTNVNVTPAFWIILGLGFVANTMYAKQNESASV